MHKLKSPEKQRRTKNNQRNFESIRRTKQEMPLIFKAVWSRFLFGSNTPVEKKCKRFSNQRKLNFFWFPQMRLPNETATAVLLVFRFVARLAQHH